MDIRPAGLSDDDENSDDELFYSSTHYVPQKENCNPVLNGHINEEDEKKQLQDLAKGACESDTLENIDKFINAGNDVNAFLNSGWTLLLHASSAASPKVIKHLLDLGANPNIEKEGYTPLLALCNSIKNTVEARLECLTLLLQAGADANFTSRMRETPLMHACNSQEADFVAELVKFVTNLNEIDIENRSALFYATILNKMEIIKVLLEKGIDTTQKDRRGMTVKDVAIAKGYEEIIPLLDDSSKNEETVSFGMTKLLTWRDLFSSLRHEDKENIDTDVSFLLNGIGLENVSFLFRGMDLKTFLKLTEEDLEKIGLDVRIHRQRFVEDLFKFHSKKWSVNSLGMFNDSKKPYTIFDTIKALGLISKHVDVMNSGFHHVRNCLALKEKYSNFILSEETEKEYSEELNNTRQNMLKLKNELANLKRVAKKINVDNAISNPLYIGPKTSKGNLRWGILICLVLIGGIYVSKLHLRVKIF